MIFLDTNFILRAVTAPTTPQDEWRRQQALLLIDGLRSGEVVATVSEVVLHEIGYNLTSSRQYGLPVTNAVEILRGFLALPGLWVPDSDQRLFHRALDLWEEHPKLEFSDAVIAARCEQSDYELASFDRHFDRLDHLRRWHPDLPDPPAVPS